jgi:hypothetical protein
MFKHNVQKKIYTSLAIILIILAGYFFVQDFITNDSGTDLTEARVIKIAACPSMLALINEDLDQDIVIIETSSTADSLNLLANGQVDYVLSGRPLKPSEDLYEQVFLDKRGYSFVSTLSQSTLIDDLKNSPIYTDQNLQEIADRLGLENAILIEDISTRPKPSWAVTSWDNTNYQDEDILHVLNADNTRYLLSRTPILYCHHCQQEIIALFQEDIFKKLD